MSLISSVVTFYEIAQSANKISYKNFITFSLLQQSVRLETSLLSTVYVSCQCYQKCNGYVQCGNSQWKNCWIKTLMMIRIGAEKKKVGY
jgi:hypothetical protein